MRCQVTATTEMRRSHIGIPSRINELRALKGDGELQEAASGNQYTDLHVSMFLALRGIEKCTCRAIYTVITRNNFAFDKTWIGKEP